MARGFTGRRHPARGPYRARFVADVWRRIIPAAIVMALLPPASGAHAGPRCEISGDARHWAYDDCLWRYETDDTLHPDVMRCADGNQALIAKLGPCQAKRIFKHRICTLVQQWQLKEPDPATCMSVDRPLGPAVREGGIQ